MTKMSISEWAEKYRDRFLTAEEVAAQWVPMPGEVVQWTTVDGATVSGRVKWFGDDAAMFEGCVLIAANGAEAVVDSADSVMESRRCLIDLRPITGN